MENRLQHHTLTQTTTITANFSLDHIEGISRFPLISIKLPTPGKATRTPRHTHPRSHSKLATHQTSHCKKNHTNTSTSSYSAIAIFRHANRRRAPQRGWRFSAARAFSGFFPGALANYAFGSRVAVMMTRP